MNWHLTVMTADGRQILFHAKLGSQTEILELASQARWLSASARPVRMMRWHRLSRPNHGRVVSIYPLGIGLVDRGVGQPCKRPSATSTSP